MKNKLEIEYKGNYIGGKFTYDNTSGTVFNSHDPGRPTELIGTFVESESDTKYAIEVAKESLSEWATLSIDKRKEIVLRYKNLLERNRNKLSLLISRETGKPLWEANIEVGSMIAKIDIMINEALKFVKDFKIRLNKDSVGWCRFKPIGVLAVLGPFNFPGHMPNGHFIPALLLGNTVIFKPSEDTPAVGQFLAELFDQARIPQGVFSLVQGGANVGRILCKSKYIDGILFTGSYETGKEIKKNTLHDPKKIIALEMGGKNPTIVANDANIDNAVYETLISCFLTTCQRCSSTSRIILLEKIASKFIKRFVNLAKKLTIGYFNENPFMGPLINKNAVEKYTKYNRIAIEENNDILLHGGMIYEDIDINGYYVKPAIYLIKKSNKNSPYQTEEIFSPIIFVYIVRNIEEAIDIINLSKYGLVASVFSEDRKIFEKIFNGIRYGLINWNRGTVGASSRLPFGGQGKSGNYRPTSLFSPYYCTYPVSSIENKNIFDPESIMVPLKNIWYNSENKASRR